MLAMVRIRADPRQHGRPSTLITDRAAQGWNAAHPSSHRPCPRMLLKGQPFLRRRQDRGDHFVDRLPGGIEA